MTKLKLRTIVSIGMILCLLSGCANSTESVTSSLAEESKQDSEISEQSEESEEFEFNILNDPEVGLQIKKEEEEKIFELMRWVYHQGAGGVYREFSPEDVLEYVSIPQVRPVSLEGSNGGLKFYSAHDSLSGGRLFVFYGDGEEATYTAIRVIFLWDTLYLQDFSELQEGISTLEDVKMIDPATSYNFCNKDNPMPNEYVNYIWRGDYYYSGHFTKEGTVSIEYQKDGEDFVIKEIYIDEDLGMGEDIAAVINDNDWP